MNKSLLDDMLNNNKKIVEHLVEAGKVLITIIIPAAVNWLLKIVLGKRK